MAGGIGDDEFPFGGREVAVGYVDRNALFAFRAKPVCDESRVKTTAGGSVNLAFVLKLSDVIFVEHLAVVEQAADEGAFTVIDASAGDETKKFFMFVLFEVSEDILGDQITLVRHIRSTLESF